MADRVSAFNRSVQFTPAENICLLEEYNSYKDILLGKFNGECSNKKKCLIWKKIATTVNSINPTVERSVKDIQKRFKNMVQDAKKEIFRRKYPKTGGGPQEKLKDTTEMVMTIYGGQSPMFWGISGGRESGVCGVNSDVIGGVPSATDSSTPPCREEEPDNQEENTVTLSLTWDRSEAVEEEPGERAAMGTGDEESASGSASATAAAPVVCTSVSRETTMLMVLDKQYRNLELEERKLLLEIEVLQLQRDKLKLDLQKQPVEL